MSFCESNNNTNINIICTLCLKLLKYFTILIFIMSLDCHVAQAVNSSRSAGFLNYHVDFLCHFNVAPFYWQFGRSGTLLVVNSERRSNFIGYSSEGAPLHWVNFGGWWSFHIYVQNYAGGWLKFILWSMLYLRGWSSRSSLFIDAALDCVPVVGWCVDPEF